MQARAEIDRAGQFLGSVAAFVRDHDLVVDEQSRGVVNVDEEGRRSGLICRNIDHASVTLRGV